MASISGSVTIAGDPDDWIACAFDADTHAFAGVAAVSGGTYAITGLTAGKAYVVACRPKTGTAWSSTRNTSLNDYTLPTAPTTTPYMYKATTAPVGDPSFASVKLLLHCDGSNNSTTFTDVIGKTVTANGNAKISTADSQFGGASGYFAASSDYLSFSDSSDWDFGTGDFTVEAWIKILTSVTGTHSILTLGQYYSVTTGSMFYIQDGKITYWGGSAVSESSASVTAGAWVHVAWSRASGTMRQFTGGILRKESASTLNFAPSTYFGIGRDMQFANASLGGYIDDLRVTKGVARYTTGFTPPTSAFPDSGYAQTGGSEPSWDTTPGNTTSDGEVTWTNMGQLVQPLMHGPLIAA